MKARLILSPILIAVVILGFQAPGARATTMYWGALMAGDVYGNPSASRWDPQVWNTFEQHAGKKLTMVHIGFGWLEFNASALETIRSRGAIPLYTMTLSPNVSLADVAAGHEDAQIRAWAEKVKGYGYPFLFRPWWEMNGDWYPWSRSPDFVAAWRHFHDVVVAEGATNVTWAWVVNGIWDDPLSDPTPYYPGDAYVDWVGLDSYNWAENPLQPDRWETPDEVLTPTIELLQQIAPGKPICVCEVASSEIGGDKPGWIRDLLAEYLPRHPEIKAFLWFNWNVEQVPGSGGRWDWPIESSDLSEQAFRLGIQRNPTYLSTLPALTQLTKVPMPDASATTLGGEPRGGRDGGPGRDSLGGRAKLLLGARHGANQLRSTARSARARRSLLIARR